MQRLAAGNARSRSCAGWQPRARRRSSGAARAKCSRKNRGHDDSPRVLTRGPVGDQVSMRTLGIGSVGVLIAVGLPLVACDEQELGFTADDGPSATMTGTATSGSAVKTMDSTTASAGSGGSGGADG